MYANNTSLDIPFQYFIHTLFRETLSCILVLVFKRLCGCDHQMKTVCLLVVCLHSSKDQPILTVLLSTGTYVDYRCNVTNDDLHCNFQIYQCGYYYIVVNIQCVCRYNYVCMCVGGQYICRQLYLVLSQVKVKITDFKRNPIVLFQSLFITQYIHNIKQHSCTDETHFLAHI